ncbi:hypothetical protein MXB_4992 [Myxobolus squamalis]|nr:hypothetical protein MXB_4992 [Myxobolus squamalis]
MDSLLTLPSRPIIIRNTSQIHPFVAKSLFKFFDGIESYCRSAFFILLINDEEPVSHVPTNLIECENAAVALLTQRWNESIPSYTLQPLLARITQFTIFI